jgi:hypothetical protein
MRRDGRGIMGLMRGGVVVVFEDFGGWVLGGDMCNGDKRASRG